MLNVVASGAPRDVPTQARTGDYRCLLLRLGWVTDELTVHANVIKCKQCASTLRGVVYLSQIVECYTKRRVDVETLAVWGALGVSPTMRL